ncbi:MAG: cyclic pyranopterin monophosphate synthase MoaC [Actinobacteria bacterium]|uniref:cyclic pyranopterin monophosphate synthase n=1 Tax=freshwater metagenome TaxID=449393 RepID=A0A6J7EDG9_9ZZZZ|nr:cyclic pyranopterin monophosphate synthase MoaC [Actinomycetota bacterium]
MSELSHIDSQGDARMVDVGDKDVTDRTAVARATVRMLPATAVLVRDGSAKGEVIATARIAGIQAAKRTAELIPLCHPLGLDHVDITADLDVDAGLLVLEATARTRGRTGVEMEAMTAASIAALTVYDMVKAAQRDVTVDRVELVTKTGGKSGSWSKDA